MQNITDEVEETRRWEIRRWAACTLSEDCLLIACSSSFQYGSTALLNITLIPCSNPPGLTLAFKFDGQCLYTHTFNHTDGSGTWFSGHLTPDFYFYVTLDQLQSAIGVNVSVRFDRLQTAVGDNYVGMLLQSTVQQMLHGIVLGCMPAIPHVPTATNCSLPSPLCPPAKIDVIVFWPDQVHYKLTSYTVIPLECSGEIVSSPDSLLRPEVNWHKAEF